MQYKTVTITRKIHQKRKAFRNQSDIGNEYEQIINKQLSDGWKLLGIHPVKTKTFIGCKKFILFGITAGRFEHYQTDIFIFFREDDISEYKDSEYNDNAAKKNKSEYLKKAGSAMINAAQGATDFIKSGEAMDKFNSLKGKIQSKIPGNKSDDEFQ